MSIIPHDYPERCYAGWLGKVIGVQLGAPIEGWTYEQIRQTYGELWNYPVNFRDFAADDDTNGPLFFLRALHDSGCTPDLTPEQVGQAWLNYAPFEHGFYWWGGYGVSTEHTAYLNMRNGVMPPHSGSIAQNGQLVAEQIGGQIFIDAWGLVAPGNPDLAARLAKTAACVAHDGNAVYGGIFIATCISAAFTAKSVREVIDIALAHIPEDCLYATMTRDLIAFHETHANWRDAFAYVKANYGYDKYGGGCHVIPNSAVIVLSMLYGDGDFDRTINICNMCGWDTDCNVGNVGCIMGTLVGLDGIDYDKWRAQVHDFLVASSVLGSRNIMELPGSVFFIARLAYKLAGEEYPARYADILAGKSARFHFELPGSTHSFRVDAAEKAEVKLFHTTQAAHSGTGSLKTVCLPPYDAPVRVFFRTHYRPSHFHDSRYDPCFSPLFYPGQTVSMYVRRDEDCVLSARAYAYLAHSGQRIYGPTTELSTEWTQLSLTVPASDEVVEEVGVEYLPQGGARFGAYLDDVDFVGAPDYRIDFTKESTEVWIWCHKEITQFTRLKGALKLLDGRLSMACSDFGEAYTGDADWTDYHFSATIAPEAGPFCAVNVRVQGAIRSYALAFVPGGIGLFKNANGYTPLQVESFDWQSGRDYRVSVDCVGDTFAVCVDGKPLFTVCDENDPYLYGCVGVSTQNCSRATYADFAVKGR